MKTSYRIKYAARGFFLGFLALLILFYGGKAESEWIPLVSGIGALLGLLAGILVSIIWAMAGYFIGDKIQRIKDGLSLSVYGIICASIYSVFYIYFILVILENYGRETYIREITWFIYSLPVSCLFKWIGEMPKLFNLFLILPLNLMIIYWIVEKIERILRPEKFKKENEEKRVLAGNKKTDDVIVRSIDVAKNKHRSKLWLFVRVAVNIIILFVCFKIFLAVFKPVNSDKQQTKNNSNIVGITTDNSGSNSGDAYLVFDYSPQGECGVSNREEKNSWIAGDTFQASKKINLSRACEFSIVGNFNIDGKKLELLYESATQGLCECYNAPVLTWTIYNLPKKDYEIEFKEQIINKLHPKEQREILCYCSNGSSYYFKYNGVIFFHGESLTWSGSFASDIKLENSDSNTFECIDSNYAKDKNNVYYWGTKVEKADPESFKPLDWPNARDKNYYFEEYKIKHEF
ncbi:MAG: DKNYY domain-containing protein [bacterium]